MEPRCIIRPGVGGTRAGRGDTRGTGALEAKESQRCRPRVSRPAGRGLAAPRGIPGGVGGGASSSRASRRAGPTQVGEGAAGSPPSRPGPPGAPPPPPSPPSLPPGGGGPGRGCGSPSALLPPPPRVRTGTASPPSPPFRPKTFRFPHPTLRDFLVPPVRAEGGEEACAAAARGDSQPPGRLAGTPGEEELHHARQVRESLRQQQRRRPPQKLGLSPPAGAGAVPLTPAAPRGLSFPAQPPEPSPARGPLPPGVPSAA
ncbi:protein diaphanous homolog 1-like [Passer domesticus]|uniref:protein diaphanous homolog 1-like n=1 Tax=Passer domesticus TaxID=48849 RepID=UPI0030FE89E1